jgi:hypothetical protein
MSNVFMVQGRIAFPQIIAPKASTANSQPKYAADIIIDPQSEDWKKIMAAVQFAAAGKFAQDAAQVLQMVNSDRRLRFYGGGSEKISQKTLKPYAGYEGMAYVSLNNVEKPNLIDGQGKPIDANNALAYQTEARKMYGGCFVNVVGKVWAQSNVHGKGIRCELVAIQFARDGERFGEAEVDVSSMFGAVAAPAAAAPAGMPVFGAAPAVPAAPVATGAMPSFLMN